MVTCIPLYAPCNLAVAAEQHRPSVAVIQYGGPADRQVIYGLMDCFVLPSLYEMAIHRLRGFQSGPFACRENGHALDALLLAYQELRATVPEAVADLRVLDAPDPGAGNACHRYSLPPAGEAGRQVVQYQHGPRGVAGSVPGIFDDCILAILAHVEPDSAASHVAQAREALALRVADRMMRGVLGVNEQ